MKMEPVMRSEDLKLLEGYELTSVTQDSVSQYALLEFKHPKKGTAVLELPPLTDIDFGILMGVEKKKDIDIIVDDICEGLTMDELSDKKAIAKYIRTVADTFDTFENRIFELGLKRVVKEVLKPNK